MALDLQVQERGGLAIFFGGSAVVHLPRGSEGNSGKEETEGIQYESGMEESE